MGDPAPKAKDPPALAPREKEKQREPEPSPAQARAGEARDSESLPLRGGVARAPQSALPPSEEHERLLRMQQTYGNAAVVRHHEAQRKQTAEAGKGKDNDKKTSPAQPALPKQETKTDNIQVALDAIDAYYLKVAAKKDSLGWALHAFIVLAYGDLSIAGFEMELALRGRSDVPAAMKAALEQFRTIRGDDLIKRLVAEPNGLSTWKKVQTDNASSLDGKFGEQYVERVEAKLLPTYALAEAKKTGKAPKKLQQIADVQIRPLIIEDLNMMVEGATQAVGVWRGLRIPKKNETTSALLEGSAGGTHFAMEAVEILFEEASLIVEIGIPYLAVLKLGLELTGIWSAQREQEEWEHKLQQQRDFESEAKNALIEMYDTVRDHTHRQLDVLSVLCASRALKAGLDPEGPDKLRLQRFVREQVFGKDSPRDLRGAFTRAKDKLAEISAEYQAKLDAVDP